MRFSYFIMPAMVLSLGAVSCAPSGPQNSDRATAEDTVEQITITGQATYRERIALRPGYVLNVTLSDISIADKAAPVLAEITRELDGAQVPLSFELTVPADQLTDRRRYSVSAKLLDADGNLAWITDTMNMIDPMQTNQNLGALQMVKVGGAQGGPEEGNNSGGFADMSDIKQFNCGAKMVTVRFMDDGLELSLDGNTYELDSVVSASGGKYEGFGTYGRVMFWNKGDGARLEVNDETYEDCNVIESENTDAMSTTLTGAEWIVEDINNSGIIDNSRVSLNFESGGRLYGSSGCNNFATDYERAGNKLRLMAVAGTRKACVPALMTQEQKFLSVLSGEITLEIDDSGALMLQSENGGTLTARQSTN